MVLLFLKIRFTMAVLLSENPIWMHGLFMCKKRNNLWAFFNLLP
nr:MAG TPA_asm: hypothetical protein [Caudoviricetes sp.]